MCAAKTARPFGQWDSVISGKGLGEDRRLDAPQWDSDGRSLLWLEGRSGRSVLVAQAAADDAPRDLTSDLDVRAELSYGGGDFTVYGGQAFFVAHKTGRIFRQALAGGPARAITPAFGKASSPAVSPDGRHVLYLHCDEAQVDRLAIVDANGSGWPQVLHSGDDFYMHPRWSPDGRRIAWLAWNHPQMPWDGTTLYLAEVAGEAEGLPRLGAIRAIAGGKEEAVFQPEFTPDGKQLLFISDATGWGRLAAFDLQNGGTRWLSPPGIELGTPAWLQGMRTYAVAHDSSAAFVAANERGFARLARVDLRTGSLERIAELAEYTDVAHVSACPTQSRVAFVGSNPTQPPRIVEFDAARKTARVVARASGETAPAAALSHCEAISWPTAGGQTCHGLYYAPASERFESAGKPPLLVWIHGGPTSQVRAAWRAEAQFFATRGFGVLFVNYRGSTGYGREYMLQLRGQWGVCDVEDAVSGAEHLVSQGRADAGRTVILGGSAGGFTVLQTMCVHPEAFAAGVNMYGVADMFHLASDTHKFESRYLDSMLGPLPEASALYRARSPVFHAQAIRKPLAVFQGSIDQVVPQAQSDSIVEALRRNGTPHEYHVYEGEGHGWRRRETIEHFYTAVEAFLRKYVLYA